MTSKSFIFLVVLIVGVGIVVGYISEHIESFRLALSMLTVEAIGTLQPNDVKLSPDGNPRANHIHLSPIVAAHVGALALIILTIVITLVAVFLLPFDSERTFDDRKDFDRETWLVRLAKQRRAASRAVFISAALTVGTVFWLISTLNSPTDDFDRFLDRTGRIIPLQFTENSARERANLSLNVSQVRSSILSLRDRERYLLSLLEALEDQKSLSDIEPTSTNNLPSVPDIDVSETIVSAEATNLEKSIARTQADVASVRDRVGLLEEEIVALNKRQEQLIASDQDARQQDLSAYTAYLSSQDSGNAIVKEFLSKREDNRAARDQVALWKSLMTRSSTILVALIFFAAALRQYLKIDRLHTENTQLLLAERAVLNGAEVEKILALRSAMYISENKAKGRPVAAPENFMEYMKAFFGQMKPTKDTSP